MLIPIITSALAWWEWSLIGVGILVISFFVLYFVVTRPAKRQPRGNWKRYSGDSRYL